MAKAADAFRTIGEVSAELDVPKHVLRFWEAKFKQLRPMKRGGGRRFYRPEDVELLRGIKALLHRDAYTIRGAQRVLRDQGVEWVKALGTGAGEALPLGAVVPAESPLQPSALAAPKTKARKQAKGRVAASPPSVPSDRRALIHQAIETLIACRALLAPETTIRADRRRA